MFSLSLYFFRMSLSDSSHDSNGCGSANYKMRVENRIVEGKQRNLQSLFGNKTNGQGSIFGESEEKGWYYLPRSSPVISRSQEKKMKKLRNNKVFHEHTDESLQKRQAPSWVRLLKTPQNIFPEEQTIPTPSTSQVLLLDSHCAPAAVMDIKCSDKQRNLSLGFSESQSSSCEEHELLNTGASPLEKGNLTCLNKCMTLGHRHTHTPTHMRE